MKCSSMGLKEYPDVLLYAINRRLGVGSLAWEQKQKIQSDFQGNLILFLLVAFD